MLTHEEIVDLAWKDQLRPLLLLQRFPQVSEEYLKEAHACAGSVVQDMGYYPLAANTSAI